MLDRAWPKSAAAGIMDKHDRVRGLRGAITTLRKTTLHKIAADKLVRVSSLPILMSGDFSRLRKVPKKDVAVFAQWGDRIIRKGFFRTGDHLNKIERLVAMGCARRYLPTPSYRESSPSKAWVEGWRYGPFSPNIDNALFPSVLTDDAGSLSLPFRNKMTDILSMMGEKGGYAWRTPTELLSAPNGELVSVAAGVLESEKPCRAPAPTAKAATMHIQTFRRINSTELKGTFTASPGSGTIVFSDAFAPGWALTIDGRLVHNTRHFHADGFANGWVVSPGTGPHRFSIYYRPERMFAILLSAQIFVYIFIGTFCLISWGTREPR